MRGHKRITSLFPSAFEPNSNNKNAGRLYTGQRDELIVNRFYYYHHIIGTKFDKALKDMEFEFFISPSTISERLTSNVDLLKRVIEVAPTRTELRKKYPHFNWN